MYSSNNLKSHFGIIGQRIISTEHTRIRRCTQFDEGENKITHQIYSPSLHVEFSTSY